MIVFEKENIPFEAWAWALDPFMDIPAPVLAIVLAGLHARRRNGNGAKPSIGGIIMDSLRGSALSALMLGQAIGFLVPPTRVYEEFYDALFRGLLSILMLVMGMEAWSRLAELRRVAHWYIAYAFTGPIVHGLIGFGLGWVAHETVGLSPGGVIILAVIASSNPDISGPPTLRAGIPGTNPSSSIGASKSIGTPVALAVCIPLFTALAGLVFGF